VLRRLLSASFIALLVAGALPVGVLAAVPVATPQSVITDEDTGVAITLAGTDGDSDPLSFAVVDPPTHGDLTGVAENLTYTPDADFHGSDSFTFKVNDGTDDSAAATVDITVNPVNDAPVAVNDPGAACPSSAFGGSFPIPEDWSGGSAGFEGWFALVASCAPMVNDSDPDGDTLTFELVGTPGHGAATSLPDGFLAYDPDPDYSTRAGDQPGGTWVSDTIHYRVFDGSLYSNTASYTLWIAPVNDPPGFTAGGDVTVAEDAGAYSGAWASTITPGPADPDQAVVFIVDDVSNPSLFAVAPSISSEGVLSFTPAQHGSGSSTVTVHAKDDGGLEDYGVSSVHPDDTSDPVVFTISVDPVNDAPVCTGDTSSGPEDADQTGTIDTCTDVEGNPLTYAKAADPAHGSVTVLANGSWTYTPDGDYNGSDSFYAQANDGTADSNTFAIGLTVTAVNDKPVATPQSVTTGEDTAKGITLTGTDVDLDTLGFSVVTGPAHGVLSGVAPDLTYTPASDYHGPDAFTFNASDGTADSDPATVSITVDPVNDAPVCTGTSLVTDKNVPISGSVGCTDVDGDTLVLRIDTAPARGSVSPFNTATGAFTYHPAPGITGADSFTVIANDGITDSAPATVDIGIGNRAPVCADAAPAASNEDFVQTGSLGCTDADLDTLTYSLVTGPAHGTVDLVAGTGAWTFTPATNWSGSDAFTARASDGVVTSNTATVTLTVTAVNDAPVADASAVTVDEDTASNAVIIGGSDVEETSALIFTVVTQPAHGTLSGTAPSLLYAPAANYNGPDSFTFKVSDGALESAPATVSITVTDVNDAPDARTDASGFGGFPYITATTTGSLGVLANDLSGPKVDGVPSEPGDPITITAVTSAKLGTVSIQPGGTALTYDPRGCLTGDDIFTYTATDSHGLTDTATVAVTVLRPGSGGLSSLPITDAPAVGLRTGASIGSTVPVRVSWCGVVKSGARIKGFRVEQSSNAGASWPTLVTRSTTSTSSSRSIGTSATYAWRVRTTDSGSRTGAFRASVTAKAGILQESPSASVVYAGSWRSHSTRKASGRTMRSATSTSASVTVTLAAGTRQVGIVGPKGSGYGSFKLWVDGAYTGSFKERASSSAYKQVLSVRGLNPAVGHTIVLKPAGNGRVYLDAIVTLQ
jgi:large repetitive protein